MSFFNIHILDIHFILTALTMLTVFILFYYSAARKQKQTLEKSERSLKNQEISIYQMNLMLMELRKNNRLLSELAGIHPNDTSYDEPMPKNLSPESQVPMGSSMGTTMGSSLNSGMNSVDSNQSGLFKLYVGNIDYAASENELAHHFSRFGQIEFVNIPVNRYTGKARGFGFVSFSSKAEAERAMALNGSDFRGRQIQVNFAKERGE